MNIDPKGTLLGYPILQIREMIRHTPQMGYTVEGMAEQLSVSERKARELLRGLEREGYFERNTQTRFARRRFRWIPTIQGTALAGASARKPFKRATADRAFAGFLERLVKVQDNPGYLYDIERVTLFGSYLGTSPTVSDIDLLVEYRCRHSDPDEFAHAIYKRGNDEIDRTGRQFNTLTDFLDWPITEIRMFLQNRSPVLSLQRLVDAEFLGEHCVIYEHDRLLLNATAEFHRV